MSSIDRDLIFRTYRDPELGLQGPNSASSGYGSSLGLVLEHVEEARDTLKKGVDRRDGELQRNLDVLSKMGELFYFAVSGMLNHGTEGTDAQPSDLEAVLQAVDAERIAQDTDDNPEPSLTVMEEFAYIGSMVRYEIAVSESEPADNYVGVKDISVLRKAGARALRAIEQNIDPLVAEFGAKEVFEKIITKQPLVMAKHAENRRRLRRERSGEAAALQ